MEMERNIAIPGRFFKVLVPGFHKKLDLTPSFCEKLKGEKSEWAILKSRKGTSKIKVCRNGDGVISFGGAGWPQFVDRHSLSIGDFVVFQHVGRLNFNVFVFDPTACEKEFLVENGADHEEALNKSRPKKSKKAAMPNGSRNPYFVTTMKYSNERQMNIPMEFVRMNNLENKTSATLKDGRGRSWPVNLVVRRRNQFRVTLHGGWHDFYVANELKLGDACVFYLNSGPPRSTTILFDVKIRSSV